MLSTSVPVFDVYVDFAAEGLREKQGKRFKDNIDSLSVSLANLFTDKNAADYKKELQQAFNEEDRYYILKKKISFDQYLQLRDFPLVRLGRNKSGFIIDPKDKRINPYVLLANRTIGLSRNDLSKNVGLELTYDSLLRGMPGQRLMRYAAGAYIPVEGSELDPVKGKDIITTLDTYMQDVAENALMKMLKENNSTHGTAIIMETATGKIKAIANLGQTKPGDSTYIEDLNYGIGKATEPGSIFKLATLMSLLEDKYVDINTTVNCNGGVQFFSGLRIKDSHLGTHETSVLNAFAASSNVAFASMADQYYHNQPQKFLDHLHKMRLDTLTGIDIVASSGYPTIKKASARSWSATTIPFMAHGYEELVTPMNMLVLYNAVANNGKMMRPYLVNEIKDYGVTIKKISPFIIDPQICSAETIAQLKQCMRAVVDSAHGTGHKILFDSAYSISGKTGTAVTALNNKGYNKGNKIYQASFIGYFPSDAPKYTMAVVIQNSQDSKLIYGADVSGRVFKDISDKLYARYLTSPSYNPVVNIDSSGNNAVGMKSDMRSILAFMHIPFTDSATSGTWRNTMFVRNNAVMNATATIVSAGGNTLPDLTGMGLKDVIYLLENKGLKIAIQGKGKVISQSIPVGTVYNKGEKVTLFLN